MRMLSYVKCLYCLIKCSKYLYYVKKIICLITVIVALTAGLYLFSGKNSLIKSFKEML